MMSTARTCRGTNLVLLRCPFSRARALLFGRIEVLLSLRASGVPRPLRVSPRRRDSRNEPGAPRYSLGRLQVCVDCRDAWHDADLGQADPVLTLSARRRTISRIAIFPVVHFAAARRGPGPGALTVRVGALPGAAASMDPRRHFASGSMLLVPPPLPELRPDRARSAAGAGASGAGPNGCDQSSRMARASVPPNLFSRRDPAQPAQSRSSGHRSGFPSIVFASPTLP